jgi:hypothetical protein
MTPRTKTLGLLFVACLASLALAGPASAITLKPMLASQQFEQASKWYYSDRVNCAGTEAAIANQPLQVSAEAYLQYPDPTGGGCGGAFPAPKNAGTGDMAVKWVLQHAAPNTLSFSNCKQGAWNYNSSATSYMQVTKQWSDPTPCGPGLYRAKSVAKYRTGDNVWHQGSVTTASILQ